MTREEAKEYVFLGKLKPSIYYEHRNYVDALWISRKAVIDFIDAIYSDFESRTCNNCEYNDEECGGCDLLAGTAREGFGCNQFERKKHKKRNKNINQIT